MSLKTAIILALGTGLLIAGCSGADQPPASATANSPSAQTLELIRNWVKGNYNNLAQAEADMQADLPPEKMHRPMHQLFVPVNVPQIEGHLVYQQSSLDGSTTPAMIFRHGLMQYLPVAETGKVIQREIYFRDADKYKNAHLNPEILSGLTIDDFTWDAGCDFYLESDRSRTKVSGRIVAGACVVFNEGLQKNMYADDAVEITATEYSFHGRFVDESGNILWGTASDELNTMVRQD